VRPEKLSLLGWKEVEALWKNQWSKETVLTQTGPMPLLIVAMEWKYDMSRPRKQTQEQKYQWMKERQQPKTAVPVVVMERRQPAAQTSIEPPYQPHTGSSVIGQADTFDERQWKYRDAADHLAISKGTLKRLTMIELAEGATGIGTLRIGPKKAQTLYTYADSALRRIHNRMTGGYYGRPAGRP
jgi:hypothetical protein